jgi:LysR family hydrogen peroxide-inducible transcriptional activator
MTLQQLKYVHAVATERHFGNAATLCRVSQPTLSMQLKKLEAEMGSPLFDRSKQPIALTEVGLQVHSTAVRILEELGGLSDWMQGATERVDGRVRLALLPTLAPSLLPRLMPLLLADFPELEVEVLERTTGDMLLDLERGTVDVGVLVTPLPDDALRTLPVFMEPLFAYVHGQHPAAAIPSGEVTAGDLPIENMLLLEEGHCFRSQALQLCGSSERGTDLGYRCESGSLETLKRLVRKTGGSTLIPGLEALGLESDPHVRAFADPQPAREVSLVVRPNYHREALLHGLKTAVMNAVPKAYRAFPNYRRLTWKQI